MADYRFSQNPVTPEDIEPFSKEEAALFADDQEELWALWYGKRRTTDPSDEVLK